MLYTAEPPASMEKSSDVHPGLLSRYSTTRERERGSGASAPPRSHRARPSKAGRVPGTSSTRKERLQSEKPEKNEVTVEQETQVKVRTTVVDIDSVRDIEVKEENLGLLEAAEEQEGELISGEKPGTFNMQLGNARQWFYLYYC